MVDGGSPGPAVQIRDEPALQGENRRKPRSGGGDVHTRRQPTIHFSTCGPTANRDCGASARQTIEYRIEILLSTTLAHVFSDMLRTLFACKPGLFAGETRANRVNSRPAKPKDAFDIWNAKYNKQRLWPALKVRGARPTPVRARPAKTRLPQPTDSNGRRYKSDCFRPCKSALEPAQTEDCSPHNKGIPTKQFRRITIISYLTENWVQKCIQWRWGFASSFLTPGLRGLLEGSKWPQWTPPFDWRRNIFRNSRARARSDVNVKKWRKSRYWCWGFRSSFRILWATGMFEGLM